MEIEFIEVEHRENVMKLMEICGLEMREAYELYSDCGYNFEVAVNRRFNPVPPSPSVPSVLSALFDPLPLLQNQFSEDEDYKYAEYKRFMASGVPFNKKYPVRKHEGFFESILPRFLKSEEDAFKGALEKYVGRRVGLKNTVGSLSEALEWSWKEKYPVLVMVLDFSAEQREQVRRVFADEMFVEQVLNQQFRLFGISAFEYELEDELKLFFNFERDRNHFLVCRVNCLDEIELLHRIPVDAPYDDLKRRLKQVKSECIQLEMEESNMAKQLQEERRGNFSYKRPRTVKESLKLREDRKIRQQQEEEFFRACLPKEHPRPTATRQQGEQEGAPQQANPQKEEAAGEAVQRAGEAVQRAREEQFRRLRKYSSGVSFKIRVPSGENVIISVAGEEKVQYLFDYVSCLPQELGFANERRREFDILVGFGGSERLRGKEGEELKSLFEDSEVLIVREAE